jgi:hypothetical protein
MSNRDDLTSTQSQELADRAHEMDGTHLHLADVQGKARSIRRRRTATAVAGVAAAVALIVPTVALASHTNGKADPLPATQITHTPSPTETAKDGQQPPPGVLDVSDLPTGAAPGIEYVTDGTVFHHADGSTADLDTTNPVSSFATLTDGTHVWQTADDQGAHVSIEIQDPDGTMHDPIPSTFGLKTNHEHNTAAWVDPDGQVMVFAVGDRDARPLGDPVPGGHDIRIAAILSQDCTEFCTVYVNGPAPGDAIWQPYEVTERGTQKYLDGGLVMVDDVAGGLTVGKTEVTDFGSCSDLYGGGEFQGFNTCKAQFESFSPDGAKVLGYPPYFDGIGSSAISMWTVTGDKLFDRSGTVKHQAAVADAEWEDADHVLAMVYQENTWSLVRIATDGSMEYAVPPVQGDDVSNPFVLSVGGPVSGG